MPGGSLAVLAVLSGGPLGLVAISAGSLVVVIFGVVVVIGMLALWAAQRYPPHHATELPLEERSDPGPNATPYPPGSRPGGPGAEGMAVPEPGEISPGPVGPTAAGPEEASKARGSHDPPN